MVCIYANFLLFILGGNGRILGRELADVRHQDPRQRNLVGKDLERRGGAVGVGARKLAQGEPWLRRSAAR